MISIEKDKISHVNKTSNFQHVIAAGGIIYYSIILDTTMLPDSEVKDYMLQPLDFDDLDSSDLHKLKIGILIRNFCSCLEYLQDGEDPSVHFAVRDKMLHFFVTGTLTPQTRALRQNFLSLKTPNARLLPCPDRFVGPMDYTSFMKEDSVRTSIIHMQEAITYAYDAAAHSYFKEVLGKSDEEISVLKNVQGPYILKDSENVYQNAQFAVHTMFNTQLQGRNVQRILGERKFEPKVDHGSTIDTLRILQQILRYDNVPFEKNPFPSSLVEVFTIAVTRFTKSSSSGAMRKLAEGKHPTPQKRENLHLFLEVYIEFDNLYPDDLQIQEFVLEFFLELNIASGKTEVKDYSILDRERVEAYFRTNGKYDEAFFNDIASFMRKCRTINTTGHATNVFNNVIMSPIKDFTSHNLPYYYGFSLINGDANPIMQHLYELPKQALIEAGFCPKFVVFNSDAEQQDEHQSCVQMNLIAYWWIDLFWDINDLEKPIQESDPLTTKKQKKMFQLLSLLLANDFAPTIYNRDSGEKIVTDRCMTSGIPWTGMIQTTTSLVVMINAYKLARKNFYTYLNILLKEGKMEEFAQVNKLWRVTYSIMIKYAAMIAMGDNSGSFIPLQSAPFFISEKYRESHFLKYSDWNNIEKLEEYYRAFEDSEESFKYTFIESLNQHGFPAKKSETAMGLFEPGSVNDLSKTDYERGYTNTLVFCSREYRWFIQNGKKFWTSTRPIGAYACRASPTVQFKNLTLYLVRINSLIMDNCMGNPQVDYFLRYISHMVSNLLSDKDKVFLIRVKELAKTDPDKFESLFKNYLAMGSQDSRSYFRYMENIDITPSPIDQLNRLCTINPKPFMKKTGQWDYSQSKEKYVYDWGFHPSYVLQLLDKHNIRDVNISCYSTLMEYYKIRP